jgi:hypothetical protein
MITFICKKLQNKGTVKGNNIIGQRSIKKSARGRICQLTTGYQNGLRLPNDLYSLTTLHAVRMAVESQRNESEPCPPSGIKYVSVFNHLLLTNCDPSANINYLLLLLLCHLIKHQKMHNQIECHVLNFSCIPKYVTLLTFSSEWGSDSY